MDMLALTLALSVLSLGMASLWTCHLITRRRLIFGRINPPQAQERRPNSLPQWLARLARVATPTGERYTPAGQRHRIERWLFLAGNPYEVDLPIFLGIRFLVVIAGMMFGALLSPLMGMRPILLLMMLGYFAPVWWLKARANDRQAEIAATLPDLLDTLAISLQAGMGLLPTLRRVSQRFNGPLGAELRRVVEQIDMGVPMAEALGGMVARTTCDEVEVFMQALVQSLELGVPVASTLGAQAIAVRAGRVQRAKEQAAKASPKITMLTTFLVTPGVFLLLIGMVLLNIYYHPERFGIDFLLN